MTLVEHLRAGANDPMWADHCEMPKRVASAAADEIERLRKEVQTAFDKGYCAAGGTITPIILSGN